MFLADKSETTLWDIILSKTKHVTESEHIWQSSGNLRVFQNFSCELLPFATFNLFLQCVRLHWFLFWHQCFFRLSKWRKCFSVVLFQKHDFIRRFPACMHKLAWLMLTNKIEMLARVSRTADINNPIAIHREIVHSFAARSCARHCRTWWVHPWTCAVVPT